MCRTAVYSCSDASLHKYAQLRGQAGPEIVLGLVAGPLPCEELSLPEEGVLFLGGEKSI